MVTDGGQAGGPRGALLERAARAARAGVDVIQVREKDLSDRALLAVVSAVRAALYATKARLLVNGRPDIALAAGADGVQVPEEGLPVAEVKRAFPSLTLGAFLAPTVMRLTRSQVLDILTQDYVRTAQAKGLSENRVVLAHVLRNAAAPVVTVVGLQFGRLLGGSIVTETVFNWPGVASLTVRSIFTSDYPVVQVATLLLALFVICSNLLSDVAVAFIDPRIRYD